MKRPLRFINVSLVSGGKQNIRFMNPYQFSRINQFRAMWVLVFFDLLTNTRKERKLASQFRERLLTSGFGMFQFSIYIRFCPSRENADVHIKRIQSNLPEDGHVAVLRITDKQFGMMEIFDGMKKIETEKPGTQLQIF